MTDNEKLARWQGWESDEKGKLFFVIPLRGVLYTLPDYLNDDAAAMSLLDTLVEKGYTPILEYARYIMPNCWICYIQSPTCKEADTIRIKKYTSREAVVAAVMELIEKEELGEMS